MHDVELLRQLISLWYEKKRWAEELLINKLKLSEAQDILKPENRGNKKIPGTLWGYRTHGIGVDVSLLENEDAGGIDFDFDKPDPDSWRLRIFFEKQYNAGNLDVAVFRDLYNDEKRFDDAVRKVSNKKVDLNKNFVKNLQSAVAKLKELGEYSNVMSRYNSAEDLAAYIESQISCLVNGIITDENLKELWIIFAPTSEWDDYVRDIDLGESIFNELDSIKRKNKKMVNFTDTQLNYIFILGIALCFVLSFFVTLYAGENTLSSLAKNGNNHAGDDSSNLSFATFFFLPFIISRFFLRRRLISLIEIVYFPVALVVTVLVVEMNGSFPLVVTIPSTIKNGSFVDSFLIFLYLISYSAFICSYIIQTYRQSKRVWAMFTEQ